MMIPDDKLILFPARQFYPRESWSSGPCPHARPVTAFSSCRTGRYQIPFKVMFRDGAWRNALTGQRLAVNVEGWR